MQVLGWFGKMRKQPHAVVVRTGSGDHAHFDLAVPKSKMWRLKEWDWHQWTDSFVGEIDDGFKGGLRSGAYPENLRRSYENARARRPVARFSFELIWEDASELAVQIRRLAQPWRGLGTIAGRLLAPQWARIWTMALESLHHEVMMVYLMDLTEFWMRRRRLFAGCVESCATMLCL